MRLTLRYKLLVRLGLLTLLLTAEPQLLRAQPAPYTLQLLHAADQEAGLPALDDAPRFSAVLKALRDGQAVGQSAFLNTLTLSSGDAYIPGLFFETSEAALGGPGRADILIQNELGMQAIAVGNHEFDFGPALVSRLIRPDSGYPGTAFPYLSSNLDVSTSSDLADLVVPNGQAPQPHSMAGSTVFTVNGEHIGVVGATAPTLDVISSPGDVGVLPAGSDRMPDLAAVIQPTVDALLAAGINKIILLAHLQQLQLEVELAGLLSGVDIIVAGGSNTILANADHRLRDDETRTPLGAYPLPLTSATGDPVVVVNTDGNYRYVGQLVVDFDAQGLIMRVRDESGIFATDEAGVDLVYGRDVDPRAESHPAVVAIVDSLRTVIDGLFANAIGQTDVFLEGRRSQVRSEETNLGNLSADASLAYARFYDPSVVLALRNGGGIRGAIGDVITPPGGTGEVVFHPPANGRITQPDVQNALRFNNALALVTVTAADLKALFEHGFAASEYAADGTPLNTQGRFPQIAGARVVFDPAQPPGARVQHLALVDEQGEVLDLLVDNGLLVGTPDRTLRIVTLSFLAEGGDGYPFPQDTSTNRVDLLAQALPVDLPNQFDFADAGSEQDALAEYLFQQYPPDDDPQTPAFSQAETAPADDLRIRMVSTEAPSRVSEED
ncbi:MAG: bifunctional metallophosphatase/5'-nucleotidase [Bacteroidota bacterium]